MIDFRFVDYLDHMALAAEEALAFVSGQTKDEFLSDRRTQQAVIMSLIVIGEASVRITEKYPQIADQNPQIEWRKIRGMRNRIVHGYFDINLDVVWDTVLAVLPALREQLAALRRSVSSLD